MSSGAQGGVEGAQAAGGVASARAEGDDGAAAAAMAEAGDPAAAKPLGGAGAGALAAMEAAAAIGMAGWRQRAVALDPNDAGNHWALGIVLAHERRWLDSEAAFAVALELDPNHADAWAMLTDASVMKGRAANGIEQVHKALQLNPHPPG